MKSQEEIRKRQQEYKDKMFNKFSNEFTRKIILQKQNQMLREEIERKVENNFFLAKAYLFKLNQVERINQNAEPLMN